MVLAAKAAEPAKDLPNRAAIKVTVRVAIEEKHVANLLCLFASRGQGNCNLVAVVFQAVNNGKALPRQGRADTYFSK